MQIFIKTQDQTVSLDVNPTDSILSVVEALESKQGVSGSRLTFGGKTLVDSRTLDTYQIQSESTLDQVFNVLGGHCQVPCGIFDDPKLVAEVKEQCATIRKAIVQINELFAKGDVLSFNQMTRWVNTKEEHCCKIITAISEYCLCQRVKPVGAPGSPFTQDKDFVDALRSHHSVMVNAMKAKQSVAVAAADALDHAVGDWSKMYLPHQEEGKK
jgi:small subunit ribosomal protein S27Ae